MAMMTAIVRSGEAAATDRARKRDSNRGKCLTSPAPSFHTTLHTDRQKTIAIGRSISRANCNCRKRTERRECGGRRTDPSLNPSLSRSSRFFTPKCDRRSRRLRRRGREEGRGSHTEESNGTRLLPAACARLSAAARRKMVSSPHLQRIAHPTFLPQSIEIPFVKRSASARSALPFPPLVD